MNLKSEEEKRERFECFYIGEAMKLVFSRC